MPSQIVEIVEVADPATNVTYRVEIRIDMAQIIRTVALKAVQNKSGKSGHYGPIYARRLPPAYTEFIGKQLIDHIRSRPR